MKISKSVLRELDLPWAAIDNKIIGHNRWSVVHEIVFEYNGKCYQTTYSIGATEMQDERPWEYETEVECKPVQRVERLIQIWEPIGEQTNE